MKAWIVTGATITHIAIVFAPTRGRARNIGMGRLDIDDYTQVGAKRAPEFDGREGNPPTMRELVQQRGWWLGCSACERVITDCDEKAVWGKGGHEVFCNEKCREYLRKARAKNRRLLQRSSA